MKHYLKVYQQLIKINFSIIAAEKTHFFSSMFVTLAWTMLSIFTIVILAGKAKNVFGWTQGELLLLTGGFTVLIGIFSVFFKRSFNRLPDTILQGGLDGVLLKPIDSQFLISVFHVSLNNILRTVVGVGFIFYVIQRFNFAVTPLSVISFFILLFLGLVIFYSVWMIAATLLIWHPRLSNIIEVVNSMNHITRYPPEIYREFNTYIFLFVLPYTFIIVTPVKVLLQRATLWDLMGLFFFAIALFYISRIFWRYALRHYTSASS